MMNRCNNDEKGIVIRNQGKLRVPFEHLLQEWFMKINAFLFFNICETANLPV